MKTLFITTLLVAGMLTTYTQACTRVVYLGKNGMVVTGRTMDWKEDLKSNIYVFPRGIERAGADKGNTIHWKSKYGSVITAGYDIGTSDGMNEKGLVANLLYLTESDYYRPNDTRPAMGISIWTQYVLDNFATVDEAVKELSKETFRIDAPDMPNGAKSTLHLAISVVEKEGTLLITNASSREKLGKGQVMKNGDRLKPHGLYQIRSFLLYHFEQEFERGTVYHILGRIPCISFSVCKV